MKLTKKVIAAVVIAGFLATLVMVPQVAEAGGRHWNRGGGHGYSHGHGHSHGYYNPGYFWGGVAAGAVTGIVVGSILAPRVYAAPPVVYQPAPVCTSYWVPTYWSGYQWVQGYWAQTCQ